MSDIKQASNSSITWQLRLRHQLKKDGISYRELAHRMKTSDPLINKHLNCQAKQESLTFIKRVCEATNYRLDWILFGDSIDNNAHQNPWLTRLGVKQWLEKMNLDRQQVDAKYIKGWFSSPDYFNFSTDCFIWQIESNELECIGFPFESLIFVDPQKKLTRRDQGRSPLKTIGTPLAMMRLKKTGGLLICRMETIADQIWCLPPSGHYPSLLMEDVDIIGKVTCCLRTFDDPLLC